jgi:hypothetical protein
MMAKLTAAARNKLPKGVFGLPAEGKYPMPDASHAANAKARATQQVKKGNLSAASAAKIKAKANRVLGKKAGKSKATRGKKASGLPPWLVTPKGAKE